MPQAWHHPIHTRVTESLHSGKVLRDNELGALKLYSSMSRLPQISDMTMRSSLAARSLMQRAPVGNPAQMAHGYSQRIGLERKHAGSGSTGALPLLMLPSLARDESPGIGGHRRRVPPRLPGFNVTEVEGFGVAQCLYPASHGVALEAAKAKESRDRRARFRVLQQQLRDERAKRRHAHDRTRARALSHALGLTCLCARVRHRELESCGAPVRLNCSIGDEFS